ncbi:MAG: AI-2E family transporter [Frankiaceae bacterium]
MRTANERVPVRTIATAIAMVLGAIIAVYLVRHLSRVIIWVVIAGFFTVLLYPMVNFVENRMHFKRSLATLVVVLGCFLVLGAMGYLLVQPLISEGSNFAAKLPDYIDQARTGRGPVGHLITRFHVDTWVAQHQQQITKALTNIGGGAVGIARTAGNFIFGTVTVVVLTFLMVLEAPKLIEGSLALLSSPRAERVRRVGGDCTKAVLGYMTGNLLISVICGASTYVVLLLTGVPYAGVIAVFVALADLIPLVGATLGAVVAVGVALLHSVTAGIIVVAFFVIYQQLENHLLQPVIMSRTVNLNPLAVFLSVLVGVELLGILGALIAIPIASMIQVIIRDVYDVRKGRLKPEPTVGAEEVPIDRGPRGGPDHETSMHPAGAAGTLGDPASAQVARADRS